MANDPGGDGDRKILLVEDNQDTAFLIENLLEPFGEVTIAGSAEAALDVAVRTPFDLVLLDINLGNGPDGGEVLRTLRGKETYQSVPMGAVTAYAMPGDRERFLQMGFDSYLSKPFTGDELISMVEQLLNLPTA
jgi:two-component system, cell cycle response regulator DivK